MNAAAIGADIDRDSGELNFRSYRPSNTSVNLVVGSRFTFSLTEDPKLFFKAALTGNNSSKPELSKDELCSKEGFFFPKESVMTFFCRINDMDPGSVVDEYGESEYLDYQADILRVSGSGEGIGREDPLVDAMVHASRYHIADEEKKRELRQTIKDILTGESSEFAIKIIRYVGGDTDQI